VKDDSNSVMDSDKAANGNQDDQDEKGLLQNDSVVDSTKELEISKNEPNSDMVSTEQEKGASGVRNGVEAVEKPKAVPVSTDSKNTAAPKPPVQSTPKKASTPKKKKTAPKKPKSKPKPIPKKDPAVDNGWAPVQSGGWGPSSCGVQVSSNVSSAQVFVDGVQKGSVGKNLTVDCGKHKLEVRADGYTSKSRSIDLTGDASFTMELSK
jgi:hypothetical protein